MRVLFTALIIAAASLTPAGLLAEAASTKVQRTYYSTSGTTLGDLLDDPAASAVLQKHLPEIVNGEGVDMARGMTLKALQGYAADKVTDEKLKAIDAELSRIPAK